jgi:ComF family protein
LFDVTVPARRLLGELLAGVLPADCLLCARRLPWRQEGGACLECWARLPWTPGLRRAVSESLSTVLWAADYDGDLRRLIQILKFESWPPLARPLGLQAAARLAPLLHPRPDLVVPVPLHWRRRLRRGFNQSHLLAQTVAGELALPLSSGLLRRVRAGRAQIGLGRQARRLALADTFRAGDAPAWRRGAPHRAGIAGRTILLVDDVTTTGATLEACGAALRRAGASAVVGLVIARTGRHLESGR